MKNGKFVSDRAIAETIRRPAQEMCDYGAWHWLLANAAFRDHTTNYNGQTIEIKRGEVPTSYRNLASEFKWSINRVRRFLERLSGQENGLKTDTLISTRTDTGFLVITICNYDEIQNINNYADTPKARAADTPTDTPTDTNRTQVTKVTKNIAGNPAKKSGKKKREKQPQEFTLEFEAFWNAYPQTPHAQPFHKPDTFRAWSEQVSDGTTTPERIMAGLEGFKASHQAKGTEPQFICGAGKFLRQRQFETHAIASQATPAPVTQALWAKALDRAREQADTDTTARLMDALKAQDFSAANAIAEKFLSPAISAPAKKNVQKVAAHV